MFFWGGPRPKVAADGCYLAAFGRSTEPRLRVSTHAGNAPSAGAMMAQMLRTSEAKAPHNKRASNALLARHFRILPPCSWPSRPSLRRLVQPALTATCARRRALCRVRAKGWPRSSKRIGDCGRSWIAREAT